MWRCASIATSNTISQAHARTVFKRALDAGTCSSPRRRREIGRVSLVEALELTLLISRKEPHRHSRVAARWLLRYLEERSETTIEEASMVAGCLSALGSDGHDDAASILRAMSERHAA